MKKGDSSFIQRGGDFDIKTVRKFITWLRYSTLAEFSTI